MVSKVAMAARIILGLIFFVFGLNGFFHFIPTPPMTGAIEAFTQGLLSSGYFFPFLKGTEVVVGILLLLNAFVPLALIILAPVAINIFLVHLFLAPEGMPMAIAIVALLGFLMFSHRSAYAPLFKRSAKCC